MLLIYDHGMDIRPLLEEDFPRVHAAFVEAFGDYAVPLQMPAEQLAEMVRRRGYVPSASVGVFDGGQLVAFTLNGLGTWRGARTGYDTGTGVVPSHRGRGLSRRMIDASFELLRAHGATQYLLEVLQSNERAHGVYRRAGFEVTRALQCWTFDAHDRPSSARVEAADTAGWEDIASFFDAPPSWQNSIDSVHRAAAPRTILTAREGGDVAGCAVVFENGDLPFLAVDRASRRRGIGRELLLSAARGRPLRIVNVDASLDSAAAFLESCGATKSVAQWEMLRPL